MRHEVFFTVGHSNRTLVEFTDLLIDNGVEMVVDVRRLAGSSRYPWFDQEVLRPALAEVGVGFRRAQGLTGRRPVSAEVPLEVNAWWKNRGFRNYADHALSEEFSWALRELRRWGGRHRVAVMCAEAVWWRCHRRIIADHLLAHREKVVHILGPGRTDLARLSEGAVLQEDLSVTYPGSASSE